MLPAVVARNFYDVIVIGTQLGPLLTAALLARRGFRVLVIAHDDLPWVYTWEGHRLQREPFMFTAADTVAVRRVLSELSLTQMFRRRTAPNEPFYQVVLPRHRIDFTGDPEHFSRELEREFPEAHRAIDAFYTIVARCNSELDKLFGVEKLTLPPESFFEHREMKRAAVHNPFSQARGPIPPFADLPENHPFRLAVLGQVRWASDLDIPDASPLQLVRLHASWAKGSLAIDGGLEGLKELVLDRISTHSGDVRHDLRANRIMLRRGRVCGVRMEGSDEVTGCNFVVLGADAHHLSRLVDSRELGRKFTPRLAQVRPVFVRYTLNFLVDAAAVPEGMARNLIYISNLEAPLKEENLLRIEACGTSSQEVRNLCVGALLPGELVESRAYLSWMRERIFDRMCWLIPFLKQHLIAIDSPHDGAKLQDFRRGCEVALGKK
jgi:phytoene dehydrogenase-like protein